MPGARLDLAYGPHPRQRLDVFPAGPNAPVLVYFHGGYWRAGSKDARRYPALAWRDRGVAWVGVNYRLVPESMLEDATADARDAVVWLSEQAGDLSVNADALHVGGNSAGGHLAAMVAAAGWDGRPAIRSLIAVSALCDLVPLVGANPNSWLGLTEQRARALSPRNNLPPADLPALIAWGGEETPAFKTQSRAYADLLEAAGNPVTKLETEGEDHFEIINGFGDPASELFPAIARVIGAAYRGTPQM